MVTTVLAVVLLYFITFIIQPDHITCNPIKRSTTVNCYGADCQIDVDFNGNPSNTQQQGIINGSVLQPELPEILALLQNIAYTYQNVTATGLPSIVNLLEEEKNLQASQNHLGANHSTILLELVSLMQNQQKFQMRQNELLENTTAATTASMSSLNQMATLLLDQAERQNQLLENLASWIQQGAPQLMNNNTTLLQPPPLQSCSSAGLSTGLHVISPSNTELGSFPVYCDMETAGGKWIVFQRRFNGSVDFYRNWVDYENGFGSLDGEFWLGLNKLHVLTSRGSRWELLVDMEDFDGIQAYAYYDNFQVGNSSSFYQLTLGLFSGTAVDVMTSQQTDLTSDLTSANLNGMAFSTMDQDHDTWTSGNCAIHLQSGWWHKGCTLANLNAPYPAQNETSSRYLSWHDPNYLSVTSIAKVLKKSEMKIRLIDELK